MNDRRTRFKAALRRSSAHPVTWYAYFATAVAVVIVTLSVLGHPNLAAVALTIAVLPAVVLQVLITAHVPLRESVPRTVLPRIAIGVAG